jgi:hypothetical protein
MKYLCLAYFEESTLDAMPDGEVDACIHETIAYNEELRKKGHYLSAHALQPVRTATTVRMRRGRISATDGPFAETNEQLGGYFLIEAADLNEAIRIASRFPPARFGSVEIRPVKENAGELPE